MGLMSDGQEGDGHSWQKETRERERAPGIYRLETALGRPLSIRFSLKVLSRKLISRQHRLSSVIMLDGCPD